MKILALEVEAPHATPAQFAPLLRDEARHLWALQQAGVVREAWFDAAQHTAVLVLECAGLEDAEAALAGLPLVREGLISFRLIALSPYTGYARLFAAGD